MTASTIPFRRPGQEPQAPKPARARKPKAPPSPYSPEGQALKAAMSALDAVNCRAQLCTSGSFTTKADDLKRYLAEVVQHARTARRLL